MSSFSLAIISGSLRERVRFSAYIMYCVVLTQGSACKIPLNKRKYGDALQATDRSHVFQMPFLNRCLAKGLAADTLSEHSTGLCRDLMTCQFQFNSCPGTGHNHAKSGSPAKPAGARYTTMRDDATVHACNFPLYAGIIVAT